LSFTLGIAWLLENLPPLCLALDIGDTTVLKTGSRNIGLIKVDAKLELEYLSVFSRCLVCMFKGVFRTLFSLRKHCAKSDGDFAIPVPVFWAEVVFLSPSLFSTLEVLLDLLDSLLDALPFCPLPLSPKSSSCFGGSDIVTSAGVERCNPST
jgi:hypothetical protein